MITPTELQIVDVFRKKVLASYTIRELAGKLKKKSYAWTFNAVKKLSKMNILKLERKGQAVFCSINLKEKKTLSYLDILDSIEADKLPNLSELIETITTPYFTLLVTGSYAQQKQTKTSDIDVIVIVDDCQNIKKILIPLQNKGSLMVPEVQPYVFTKTQYLQMLLAEEMNYGKLSYENHILVYGAHNYYKIIDEAIQHGFRG